MFSPNTILEGHVMTRLKDIPSNSINCCVTSPPYYNLRDYGVDGQIGLEETPERYIDSLVDVFREVKRVLMDNGTLWIVIGDSYNGSNKASGDTTVDKNLQRTNIASHKTNPTKIKGLKPKDLIGIPWMLAFALRADGWYLRQDIIWHKPNPMPESVKDRCTKSHEYVFLLSKSRQYFFDAESIKTISRNPADDRGSRGNRKRTPTTLISGIRNSGVYPLANKRSVWSVPTKPFKGAHFAVFPESLIETCIKAGCPQNGFVLDPFFGSGTVGVVARRLKRNYLGIELNVDYIKIAENRINNTLTI